MSEIYLKINTGTKVGKIFKDLADSLKGNKGLAIAQFEEIEEHAIATMINEGMKSGKGNKNKILKMLNIK